MHVEALLYTQLDPLPCHAATAPEQLEQWLALQMSQHTRRILSHGGDKPRHHFVSSTSLANSLNRNRMNWSRWSRACQQHHGIQPTAFMNAYECAGWGYALRLARHLDLSDGPLMVSIIDINAYGQDYWVAHEKWGRSGFGLCTLMIHDTGEQDALRIANFAGNQAFTYFAMDIRKKLAADPKLCAALPFFPQKTQQLIGRTLGEFPRLTDRHDQWGHCFGADPWLAILSAMKEGEDISQYEAMLTCSLAFCGYYSLARVTLARDGLFDFLPVLEEG